MSELVESNRKTEADLARVLSLGAKILLVTLGGVAFLAFVVVSILEVWGGHSCRIPRRDLTRSSAKTLHAVVEAWRANHADACPTFEQLVAERELARSWSAVDAWGSPWIIECHSDETVIRSAGEDLRTGTTDDVVVPALPTLQRR